MKKLRTVAPSPEVVNLLINEYHRKWKGMDFTFDQFLTAIGYRNHARGIDGMDDDFMGVASDGGVELIQKPDIPFTGKLHVMVLLVDFPGRRGYITKEHYEDLLFSKNSFLTGSMADYYSEVSRGKVEIEGEVHGWLRMPRNYNYYTNGNSGLTDEWDREYYPRDARKLAEDAVDAALADGITFDDKLDSLGNGTITALFIVHSGRGAEKLAPRISGDHIWSHKWDMVRPKQVVRDLWAITYLMVPQEALLGVCAHELGHLAFQWQDFYDPNYYKDGDYWDGNGIWDLMAGGSYAGREMRPVHPAGLHKLQHGWIESETIDNSRERVVLKPITNDDGKVLKIRSDRYQTDQYLLLENRAKKLFDTDLPGEGLLVWRIDESEPMEGSRRPGMLLIQADGRHHLLDPDDGNNGDPGDPFPGSKGVDHLRESGTISTSFPGGPNSGIELKNIEHDPVTKNITLDIVINT